MAYITALVIQQDHTVFVSTTAGTIGSTMLIPTPNSGGQVDSDYWATPVTGFGIEGTGFKYTPTTPGSTDKPDAQSFHVIRVIKNDQSTAWWVLGTSTDYTEVSEEVECCGTTSPAPAMPISTDLPVIAACQTLCDTDANGLYFGMFAIPTPDTGTYSAKGYYNDVALPTVTGADRAALVTALNANGSWNAIGTWTAPGSSISLLVTQSAGDGTDVLCAVFTVA